MVGRPLSWFGAPTDPRKPVFIRTLGETMPGSVRGIEVKEKAGMATYIAIEDLSGLISLVQMGVLEIHPWGAGEIVSIGPTAYLRHRSGG